MSPYEQDLVDLLDIIDRITLSYAPSSVVKQMITTMRKSITERGRPEGGIYVPLSNVEVRPEDGQRKDED